ncbi:hypothetical protein DPMN_003323 [Dreissena polymorpha]|uniref:Uncharacterized protein n=1 Tax=Dreissena polymorpha TaxID=45954 RepID=A0A9D4RUM1_DREPO|nr:hypothetical protein DPMN_003323 [Dreissena polymorpha]
MAQVLEETLWDLVKEPEAVAEVVIPEMQRRLETVMGALQVAGWTHEELLKSLAGRLLVVSGRCVRVAEVLLFRFCI